MKNLFTSFKGLVMFLLFAFILLLTWLTPAQAANNAFIVSLSTVQGSGSVYSGTASILTVYVWNYSTSTVNVCLSQGNNTLKGMITLATNTAGTMTMLETVVTNSCVYISTQVAIPFDITTEAKCGPSLAQWNSMYQNKIGAYVLYEKR